MVLVESKSSWGKDDEQGKVDKLEQGTEANSGTKDKYKLISCKKVLKVQNANIRQQKIKVTGAN
ncbi:hypothetical protein HYE05_03865 [Mycoplasmopsis bovis]|nr:hypothetical protein [Mycoplasmopsis bovis]QQH27664.1 hypothetical protein HYE05_03865 [Mycoplasmopsis bovis]